MARVPVRYGRRVRLQTIELLRLRECFVEKDKRGNREVVVQFDNADVSQVLVGRDPERRELRSTP